MQHIFMLLVMIAALWQTTVPHAAEISPVEKYQNWRTLVIRDSDITVFRAATEYDKKNRYTKAFALDRDVEVRVLALDRYAGECNHVRININFFHPLTSRENV